LTILPGFTLTSVSGMVSSKSFDPMDQLLMEVFPASLIIALFEYTLKSMEESHCREGIGHAGRE
jgi:hypothetical protein